MTAQIKSIHLAVAMLGALTGLIVLVGGDGMASPLDQLDITDAERVALGRRILDAQMNPSPSQDSYDALHYDLSLRIAPDSTVYEGSLTMTARNLDPGVGRSITLDLSDTTLSVAAVSVDGESAGFTHADDLIWINMPPSIAEGDTFTVTVVYDGWPHAEGYGSFTVEEHRSGVSIQSFSEPFYARTWWPCKDRPDDKVTTSLHITVPDTMTVTSNGLLSHVEDRIDGWATSHWNESYPIATYLVSLAISNYEIIHDTYISGTTTMPIIHYAFPHHVERARIDFERTPEMMNYFAGLFGEYPFIDEKYGMAVIRHVGALEHQTLTSIGSNTIIGNHAYDHTFAHELAHQWWGDMVTLADWRDIWLNEGFASYSEALWAEHTGGLDAYLEWFTSRMHLDWEGTIYDPLETISPIVYMKGAFVLHMLRGIFGKELLFDALLHYRSLYEYDVATTFDFQEAVEAVIGEPLDWFFDQWVFGEDRPTYAYAWDQSESGDGVVVNLLIEQVQDGPVFRMPLTVRLYGPHGSVDARVVSGDRIERFWLEAGAPIDSIGIDPDGWVLRWMDGEKPFETLSDSLPASAEFALSPNPARGAVRILYDTRPRSLNVYDAVGRLVRRLEPRESWSVWDTRNASGAGVSSGVYWIRGDNIVRRVVVVR